MASLGNDASAAEDKINRVTDIQTWRKKNALPTLKKALCRCIKALCHFGIRSLKPYHSRGEPRVYPGIALFSVYGNNTDGKGNNIRKGGGQLIIRIDRSVMFLLSWDALPKRPLVKPALAATQNTYWWLQCGFTRTANAHLRAPQYVLYSCLFFI